MGWTVREKKAETDTNSWYDPRYPFLRTKMNLQGRRGWPDECYWLPLRPLLIEFKRVGEDPRSLQEHTHDQLRNNGYEIQVHTSAKEAIAAIREAIEERIAELDRLGLPRPGPVGAGGLPAGRGEVPGVPRKRRAVTRSGPA